MRPDSTASPEADGVETLAPGPDAPVGAAGDGTTAEAQVVETAIGPVRVPPRPTRSPRRRAPKLDDLLAAAVDVARSALGGLAEDGQVGAHVGAVADDDRLVTHRFSAALPGYGGWEWFATLSRAPRSRHVTVCEVGLLPGQDAILAPDWLPWSERASQEEKVRLDAIAAGEDPEKALARFRGEADEESDAAGDAGGPDGGAPEPGAPPAGAADVGEDADDVDAPSDAADPDADEDRSA